MTRVIAPEPAVGDVVTKDMDLPEGSIIERATDQAGLDTVVAVVRQDGRFWSGHSNQSWVRPTDYPDWRIVRIGGTP